MSFSRSLIIFTVSILYITKMNAQDPTSILSKKLVKLELMTPGVSWEWQVRPSKTIRAKAGMFSALLTTFNLADGAYRGFESHFFLHFDIQYRKYYNLLNRMTKGRSTAKNSGNYWAAKLLVAPPHFLEGQRVNEGLWLGPIWGMQRQLNERLSIDLAGGVGVYRYFNSYEETSISPMLTVNFGYELRHK